MKIDTKDIVKQSELFARDVAQQIAKIAVKPFFEISFHSFEFRDKAGLKGHLHKITKNSHPLIYVIEVQSSKKIEMLTGYFEIFHCENKQRIKNADMVNLSKYNKTLSNTLYVGSSTTDFKTRIKNHFSTQSSRVYSLHLCRWDKSLDYDLKISAFEVISESEQTVERFIVEILEQQFWDKLRPIFGKRSGL